MLVNDANGSEQLVNIDLDDISVKDENGNKIDIDSEPNISLVETADGVIIHGLSPYYSVEFNTDTDFNAFKVTYEDGSQFKLEEVEASQDFNPNLAISIDVIDSDGDTAQTELTLEFKEGTFIVGENVSDVPGENTEYEVGDNSGTITGTSQSDVLVGDVGGATQTNVDTNIILVLDTSGSMQNTINFDGESISRLEALQRSVENLLTELTGSQANNVRVHIVEFNSNSTAIGTYDLITNGVSDIDARDLAIDTVNALDDGGRTNYESGLQRAIDWIDSGEALTDNGNLINQTFFISDGVPNRALEETNGVNDYSRAEDRDTAEKAMNEVLGIDPSGGNNGDDSNEVAYIENNFGNIEAIGINVSSSNLALLDQIEGEASGSGAADNVRSGDDLNQVLSDLNPLSELATAGDDEILGGDGDDLIFGDTLNTDLLALDQGINLPEGSGWAVLAELENNDPSWGREETLDYIRNNAEELAVESTLDGQGRDGGHDHLVGGAGDDTIFGQEGDDLISGGTGNNTLSGGSGNNTFEFSMLDLDDPDTVTTITDFNVNKDSLSFKDVFDDNGNNTGELDDIDANIQSISNVNTDSLEITMNSGAQIIIENFGAIDPGVNGLGDLPSLDVQVDVI